MNLNHFVKTRPYLFWSNRNPAKLSPAVILENTLNYGDFSDVKILLSILGQKKAAAIFQQQIKSRRANYRPVIKNYFQLYFKKYAS